MTGRERRRISQLLTGVAALTFPRTRRGDGRVVRDCAREAVDTEGLRSVPRECLSLAAAGLRTRPREAALEPRCAPWRAALSVLALPLASTLLVVWIFGFIPRYDHWPLGEGWALLLGGSLLAVIGAALQHRWLTAIGGAAVFVAAAAPYVGYRERGPGQFPHAELLLRGERRPRRRIAPPHPAAGGCRAQPPAQPRLAAPARPGTPGTGPAASDRRARASAPPARTRVHPHLHRHPRAGALCHGDRAQLRPALPVAVDPRVTAADRGPRDRPGCGGHRPGGAPVPTRTTCSPPDSS